MSNPYLPVGTVLQGGRYRIIRFISSGGFGCTYEAVHVRLGKKLAIKEFFVKDFCNRDETTAQVSVGTSSKKGLVKRLSEKFCEEAQALSELSHPGIVRVSDVFDENGTSYFVMDYVDGKSLGDIVKIRGPLSENLAVQFIRQVATALKYVHSHNRLHLDIKPGNVMVNKEGKAILIDFGASKQYDEVEGENTSTLLGKTPGYAPIEQMGNDVVTFHPATDIYALGGTLYKLLTGKTPMSATRRVSGEEMEPLPEGVSEPVKLAVMKSMELNKNNRPQSVDEFLEILDGVGGNADARGFIKDVVNDDGNTLVSYFQNPGSVPGVSYSESSPQDNGKDGMRKLVVAVSAVVAIGILAAILVPKMLSDSTTDAVDSLSEVSGLTLTGYEVIDSTIITEDGTMIYTGPVNAEGLPNGQGIAIYHAESYDGKYEGEFKDGKRSGEGEYHFSFKDGNSVQKFKGTFENDMYKEGKIVDENTGAYFEGSFLNEMPFNGEYYTKYGVKTGSMVNGKKK